MDKPFHIFELTKELIDDIRSRSYDSHFHDFEELIIITSGSLEHFIDFRKEVMNKGWRKQSFRITKEKILAELKEKYNISDEDMEKLRKL